jgi:hypothetical protein
MSGRFGPRREIYSVDLATANRKVMWIDKKTHSFLPSEMSAPVARAATHSLAFPALLRRHRTARASFDRKEYVVNGTAAPCHIMKRHHPCQLYTFWCIYYRVLAPLPENQK